MARTVLVVGGSGYLGRHVVSHLRSIGCHVVLAGRTASSGPRPHGSDNIDVDVLTPEGRARAAAVGADVLLQLAWDTRHGRFWSSPSNLEWVGASLDLARRFVSAGGSRVVGVGSCAEHRWPYHPRAAVPPPPGPPKTLYGTAKRAVADVVEAFCAEEDVAFAWPRVFFSFGGDEDPRRLVPSLVAQMRAGERPTLREPAAQRDFLPVECVGEAVARATLSEVTGAFDVGAGYALSISAVALLLSQAIDGKTLSTEPADSNDGWDVVVADVRTLNETVGYTAPVDLASFWRRAAGASTTVAQPPAAVGMETVG